MILMYSAHNEGVLVVAQRLAKPLKSIICKKCQLITKNLISVI